MTNTHGTKHALRARTQVPLGLPHPPLPDSAEKMIAATARASIQRLRAGCAHAESRIIPCEEEDSTQSHTGKKDGCTYLDTETAILDPQPSYTQLSRHTVKSMAAIVRVIVLVLRVEISVLGTGCAFRSSLGYHAEPDPFTQRFLNGRLHRARSTTYAALPNTPFLQWTVSHPLAVALNEIVALEGTGNVVAITSGHDHGEVVVRELQ
ncbi:hypothetical protein DFH09DRAFT_1326707 [Mycena vulgaris]|nr:hypothetical protein DFH09DRAFT_1326707 [Mycena vulgaris]